MRPFRYVLIADQILMMFGYITSCFVYFRIISLDSLPILKISLTILLNLFFSICVWHLFKLNRRVIKYFHSIDYLHLIASVFIVYFVSYFSGQIFPSFLLFGIELNSMAFFVSIGYLIFSKIFISILYTHYRTSGTRRHNKRLLIFGAGELGIILKKSVETYHSEYDLVGYVDDDKNKEGGYIEGIRIHEASGQSLIKAIVENGVTDIIIASKAMNSARKAKFLDETIGFRINIREVSSQEILFNKRFKLENLSTLDICDLMNREQIKLEESHVNCYINGKVVLVTGAAGSIGSEIVRKVLNYEPKIVICIDFAESALYNLEQEILKRSPSSEVVCYIADIKDNDYMSEIFQKYKPEYVFHAAAYKHVPLMERHPWLAIHNNFLATVSIAKLAMVHKVSKFVFISTDKAVNPTSIMGASKRLAEIAVRYFSKSEKTTSFIITRFGNVLGSNGSVVPLFTKQIQDGGPVKITHPDVTRYFMTIAEASQLVLEAAVMGKGGEIFVFDMGEPVKIVDLAKNMIRLAGYIPDVDIKLEYTGLRPGEKLYEELFDYGQKIYRTNHNKIMISKESGIDQYNLLSIINHFYEFKDAFDSNVYKAIIGQVLNEYNPYTSDYTMESENLTISTNNLTKMYA